MYGLRELLQRLQEIQGAKHQLLRRFELLSWYRSLYRSLYWSLYRSWYRSWYVLCWLESVDEHGLPRREGARV